MVSPSLLIGWHKYILTVSQGLFQNLKVNTDLTFALQPTLTKQCIRSFSLAHMPCNENDSIFFVCIILIAQLSH